MAELGFIGLGIMGKPMAAHLVAAGQSWPMNSGSELLVRGFQRFLGENFRVR